jgi:long-chain acyl-CoA synthetase
MKETSHTALTIKRVFDTIPFQIHQYPQKKALNAFADGQWQGIGIAEVVQKIEAIAAWFLEQGFKKGDTVAIVPVLGRPEWMLIDFACQQLGVILVPMHPTASDDEILFILNQTEAKLCLAADSGLFYKLQLILQRLENRVDLFHLDTDEKGYFDPLDLQKPTKAQIEALLPIKNSITENDVLTILYTSGTSGVPKGVVLTHGNLVSNILASMTIFPLQASESVLSFLPFSHILERSACYTYVACGVSLYFSRDRDSLVHDLQTVRPTFCTMVPRVLEKLYGYVHKELLGKNPIRRFLMKQAVDVAKNYTPSVYFFGKGFFYNLKLAIVRLLVLNKWHRGLGGKLQYIAVGAASMNPEISRFFQASNIAICEGYGMTETSPLIAMNRFQKGMNRFGTVGIPLPHVHVKIDSETDEAGEIWVKGPNVMREYYKNPEMTEEAFTPDGWLKTGDVGVFVDGKFLKITDRKKDIFKTSSGKYIAPQPLENHFKTTPYIQQCLIIGFNRPFVTALIVPNFALLEKWCAQESIHWTAPEYMIHNIKVRAMLQKEIDKRNKALPNNERLRDFALCPKEWTTETGEMTTSFKPLRDVLQKQYAKEVEKMYDKIK